MVSRTDLDSGVGDEPWRVLVVASDAEATSADLLELEAQAARGSLGDRSNGAAVNSIATLRPKEFVGALEDYRPNLVHFTRRGSVERNIRMLDANGWIRQITGETLAKRFRQAGCGIPVLMLWNCGIFREQWHVSEFSEYLFSFRSEEATHQLPISLVEGIYGALGTPSEPALDSVFSYVSESPSLWGVEFRSFGGEAPGQGSDLRRRYLEPWGMPHRDWTSEAKTVALPVRAVGDVGAEQPMGVAAREEDGPRKYRVWFGTNRRQEEGGGRVRFGSARADGIAYGHCDVTIPKYHSIGSVGESWWKRFPRFWRDNRLTIDELHVLARTAFHSELRELFDGLSDDERTLLVFLHGFNVSFERAAIRAAQLGFDLGVGGATAFFSWPSRGRVARYAADIASLEASEKHIADFLLEMGERSGASRIHLIAHSMGNRGLLRAFHGLARRTRERIGRRLDQVFLAAPDIDEDVFRSLSDIYRSMARRTTMYVSPKDLALFSSGIVHDHPRAGYTPPVTVVEGVDTVEVSNVDLTCLGHGYVASARPVLSDMHSAMRSDAAPDSRFGLQSVRTDKGEGYWRIRS